ncbi:sulfotransferase family protein [Nocardioides mangrovi]|uniref:Sulfotransferase n=1 Tax=Nocardioides mangrovi TaxID=2874580 RepID=A0ABS7U7Y2_9ACTN|nr:sulfotransferase [Nocardioides mangrovi]MBZ5737088.1 sulfotransferase [Nocardioides mangrovi]
MVHLDDLTRPRFSPEIEELRGLMATMAEACPLDAAALHAQAAAETGLDDFGARDYEERLDVLLAAIRDIDGLHGPGQVNFHAQLLQLLKNRLLLTEYLTRHPEALEVELAAPVIIAGLPRTGTTHLHNLLAAGPTFRTLPYWESVEPLPMPGEDGVEPRRARMDMAVDFMNAAMPYFPLMHEMTTDHVHEEIQLLANDFSTMLFETLGEVPAWRDYYLAHDQTPHYAHLRTQLQVLQHARGGRRWLLKSPQHLEQLPVLAQVFPHATVVLTHRDPVSVTVSMVTMIVYTARMHRDPVPAREIGRAWADRLAIMLDAVVRDREVLAPERSVDVRFDDFMSDDLATAQRVYALAGEPVTPEARSAMAAYLDGHRRGHLGTIDYAPAEIGLDPDELRTRFAPYVERFLG